MTAQARPAHILVIDEEPAILDLIRELLEGEGFRVSTRRNAEPELQEVKALAPDLIVIDAPRMGQHELAAWLPINALRLDRATRAIPVVLCTGDRDALQAVDELEAHGLMVIAKPFDIASFVSVVRAALSSGKGATAQTNVTNDTPVDLLA